DRPTFEHNRGADAHVAAGAVTLLLAQVKIDAPPAFPADGQARIADVGTHHRLELASVRIVSDGPVDRQVGVYQAAATGIIYFGCCPLRHREAAAERLIPVSTNKRALAPPLPDIAR